MEKHDKNFIIFFIIIVGGPYIVKQTFILWINSNVPPVVSNMSSKQHFNATETDVLDVTRIITTILRAVSLSRVERDRNGKYYVGSTRRKAASYSAVIILVVIIKWVDGLIQYEWRSGNNLARRNVIFATFLMNDAMHTMQAVSAVFAVARQGTADIFAYYENMRSIDRILYMSKYSAYKKDKMKCTTIFIAVPLVRFLVLALQLFWFVLFYIHRQIFVYAIDFCLIICVDLHIMDYVTRLMMFVHRLERLQERVHGLACGKAFPLDARCARREDQIERFALCYYLMIEQSCIINKVFGFQVVLVSAGNVLNCISSVHSLVSFIAEPNIYNSIFGSSGESDMWLMLLPLLVGDFLRAIHMFSIIFFILSNVQRVNRTVQSIIFTANMCATDYNLSERLRGAWSQLERLCRRFPLEFTACGVFTLDYGLVGPLLGAMITYTVMLTQIKDTRNKSTYNATTPS